VPVTLYYAIALSMSQAVSLAVAFLAWRRRSVTGSLYLALMMLAVAVWSAAAAIEAVSADQSTKIIWSQMSYVGIAAVPTLLLLFALKYWRPAMKIRRLYKVLLWIIPLCTIVITATNGLHHLLWNSFTFEALDTNVMTYGHGIWFWINVAYSYALMLASVVLLSWVAIGFPRLYRRQAVLVLIAAILPWIGNAIYVFGGSPLPGLDIAPIAFSITGLILVLGILKLRLFDVVPVARESMIQHMDIGMMVLDYKARIVDLNPATERIIGKKLEVGQRIEEVLGGWQEILRLPADVSERKEVFLEQRNPSLWLDVGISPLRDRGKRLSGQLITLQDITERKLAEAALRESEARLQSLFETMMEGVVLIAPDGQIVQANPAAERILGIKRSEITTRSYIAPEWRILRSDGTPMPAEEMAGPWVMKEKRPIKNMLMGVDHQDGTVTWINVSASPLLNDVGELEGIVGTFTDITERKHAEEELRRSENRYRLLAENATDVIYTLDMNQRVTYVSPSISRLLGYSVEEAFTKRMEDILTPDSYRMQVEKMKKNLEIRNLSAPVTLQLKAIHKDGSIRDVEVTASFMLDIEGALLGILGICRDITERKRAEEALIEAHNALQHQATHDPLTGILNRRAILDILSRELARARRQHTGLVIGICDIDNFKKINDTYGHLVGDEVLCGLVRIMKNSLRQYDTLGRFGGEEFLLVTPGVKGNDAITLYQRLLSEVAENSLATKSGNVSITVSIGVKILTGEEHVEELLKAADDALYDAKNSGRNRVFLMNNKQS
jgi:diguanylate cyclase (GGDEF)-like protein/PAS domain S-box-containing protein